MTIKEFFVRFGADTTTNFDLMHIAKELKIPLQVVMKDEIASLKRIKKRPLYAISNYHSSNQSGIHWVCFYVDRDHSYYFDSFGIAPLQEAKDFLKHGVYSTLQIQSMGQTFCGQVSAWVLYQLSLGNDFYQTVLDLHEYFKSLQNMQ